MPIVKTLHWTDEAACQAFAQALVQRPHWGEALVCLHGELGAGKTTLVRFLLQAMGVTGRIKSPTYAVVEPYELSTAQGVQAIWHFDFYRFSDPREWEDAGFRDIFVSPGLKLCEWPEKAQGFLPTPDLDIVIAVLNEQERDVRLQAHTALGEGLLA
jgi:tRNA threonylcarbamoyladenosine biosynthesis protein TsaE